MGHGRIAKALGKMLKLNEVPLKVRSLISRLRALQKWPRYMKTLNAASIPQTRMLRGIT